MNATCALSPKPRQSCDSPAPAGRRSAFTLVEMMVAMALVLFIMVILSQAFIAGLEAFRQLKSIGDMEERLRSASVILRRDLLAEHFDAHRRFSDPKFWDKGPPAQGFFRVQQDSPIWPAGTTGATNVWEGYDADGFPSVRAVDHKLHFTVKLQGNTPQDFFVTNIRSDTLSPLNFYGRPDSRYQDYGTYTSQWAEVVYFLKSNNDNAVGTPLYTFFRRQRLLVPNNTTTNNPSSSMPAFLAIPELDSGTLPYGEISYSDLGTPSTVYFNSPVDVTIPERRFGMTQTAGTAGMPVAYSELGTGNDIVLTDVVSFQISLLLRDPKALTDFFGSGTRQNSNNVLPNGYDPFIDLWDSETLQSYASQAVGGTPLLQTSQNSLIAALPPTAPPAAVSPRFFDSWSSVSDGTYDYSGWKSSGPPTPQSAPFQVTAQAIRITLRIWDRKTQNTRQITLIQEL